MRVALTARDRQVITVVSSLGLVTSQGLRRLVSPGTGTDTFSARLRLLLRARYLTRTEVVAGLRRTYLYGIGIAARAPGAAAPWRPGLAQLDHTLTVERSLLALLRDGFCPPVTVTSWVGEADIRGWAQPGDAFPDLRVSWTGQGLPGRWDVEVDRGTEASAAWRRKLARYPLYDTDPYTILVVTTSTQRARNIARLASRDGYPLLATTLTAVSADSDPDVWDATFKRRHPLSEASLDAVDANTARRPGHHRRPDIPAR